MKYTKTDILKNELNSKKPLRIKLLGDSITHGFGGTDYSPNEEHIADRFHRNNKGHCWANSFRDYMKEKYDCTVINNGCSGTKVEFIIKHFDTLVEDSDDFIICTIGTNNRRQLFTTGEKCTREAFGKRFYNNLIKVYNMCKEANKKVLFVANIPAAACNEQDKETFWRILYMNDINEIHKRASEKCGFPLISLYDLFTKYCSDNNVTVESLLCDEVHPNDAGYDVMFNLMVEALEV